MPLSITVLLVDDHDIFREGVRTLLETQDNIRVVGESRDGLDALTQAKHLRPDVVVLDCEMPRMSGIEIIRSLITARLTTHVVILSMHNDESYVFAAIKNGASGYILKEDIVPHLTQAVRAAATGNKYFSPSLNFLCTNMEHESK